MSDLISRNELIYKIRGIVPGSQDVDFIVGLIENQPTAFDTEKVVAELEAEKWEVSDWRDKWRNEIISNCIDIVKRGGIE